ncbi:serine/threonine-protein kinase [Granulosicoccaceae sp. 1_MG-2023]|nr:serine/threonine-protein kinase [Granulosicoccaceae sp. 1_MG-2023]
METSSDAATVIAGQPADALPPGTHIHNYRIIRLLGRGAFGLTYLAEESQLQRLVAIKEYLPATAASRDNTLTVSSQSPESEEFFRYGLSSFLQEARTLVQFDHPNIVRVLTYFQALGTAYLVMNYETGQNFNQWLKENPGPSEADLLAIFLPINRGLQQVHEAGYIHRDIKADNIYIRGDGTPVLLDFGAARDIRGRQSGDLTRILTPGYAPFEQENPDWKEQGPWTDIYALAATLYYAVRGKRPPNGSLRAAAVFGDRPDPYEALSRCQPEGYSTGFLHAIDQALAFDPAQRPATTQAWNKALAPEAAQVPTPAAAAAKRPGRLAVMLLLLAGVSGLGWWWLQGQAPDVALSEPDTTQTQIAAPDQPLSPPVPAAADQMPMARSLVVSALLLSKTACWHEARGSKIADLISNIRNLPATADRTRFLVDQQNKLDESREGFAGNTARYFDAVSELAALAPDVRAGVLQEVLAREEYQQDPVYPLLAEVLATHAALAEPDLAAIRDELKELSRNGLMEQG